MSDEATFYSSDTLNRNKTNIGLIGRTVLILLHYNIKTNNSKEKGGTSPTYAAATRGQTTQKDGEWQLVEKKKRIKTKREGKESSYALCTGP